MKWFVYSCWALLLSLSFASCKQTTTYPDVSQASFTLITGDRLNMQSLRGSPILVTFWATSCRSCLKEIPDLIALHEKYSSMGFKIIAVAMPYDRPDHVLEFTRENNLPYAIALDIDSRIVNAFGNIQVTPNNFLINPDGRIHQQQVGILDINKTQQWLDNNLNPRS